MLREEWQNYSPNDYQRRMLDMLNEFHIFCENNNLRYFLGYGSLIGAIRHNGFIPWDDDIDVVMPRPDYERLLELKGSNIGKTYSIKYGIGSLPFCFSYIKIVDTSSSLTEKLFEGSDSSVTYGLYLDVWPLDGCKKNTLKQVMRATHFLVGMINNNQYEEKRRGFSKRAFQCLSKCFKLGTLLEIMESFCSRIPYESSEYVTNYSSPYGSRELLKREWFDKKKYIYFNGVQTIIPDNYDEILKTIYGDYMKLPPLESQISNHSRISCDLFCPYE